MRQFFNIAGLLTFAFFTTYFSVSKCDETVVVETKHGKLEGSVVTAVNGFKVNQFLGIQYGRVLDHFTKPVPVQPWKEIKEVKALPPRCFQFMKFGETFPFELPSDTENCLYANIFAPHQKNIKRYPVMVFVHGGGMNLGSSHEYGLEGICNWIVPKGVIFVNFHYRLGPFGFFTTGTDDAPGNYALWDQHLLLQWVNDNIAQFGGDPSRITVFGESAGAYAASILTLSPYTRNLFQQAILMSGVALSSISFAESSLQKSVSLAQKLGCNQNSPKEWLSCVRSKSASEIRAAEIDKDPSDPMSMMFFAPRYDSDFVPKHVESLVQETSNIPIIIGATGDEIEFLLKGFADSPFIINEPEKFSFDDLRMRIYYTLVSMQMKNVDLITDFAIYHFVDSVGDRNNATFLIEAFKEFSNGMMTYFPTVKEIQLRLQKGDQIWLYSFEYYNSELLSSPAHFMDLWYLFKFSLFRKNLPYTKEEEKVAEYYSTLFTNFAKFGNPTPEKLDGVLWTSLSNSSQDVYLKIADKLEMQNFWHRRSNSFWNILVPKIQSLNLAINTQQGTTTEIKEEL